MNKYETYFGQIITDDELNEIFDTFSSAFEQFALDYGFVGIAAGAELAQNGAPNMSVLVNAPGVVYDQAGNRILFATPVNVSLAYDESNLPTGVVTAGNEKYISIFVEHTLTPSDPREDELGNTVYFRKLSGYQMHVVAGPEAPIDSAPRASLRGNQILLGDVRIIAGQTQVLTDDIDMTRAQFVFDAAGSPLSIKEKKFPAVIQSMVDAINGIGADTITIPLLPGDPNSLPSDTLKNTIAALLQLLNTMWLALDALSSQVNGLPTSLSGVAMLAANNTFTGDNRFEDTITFTDTIIGVNENADRALVSTSKTPADHPGIPENKWKLVLEFKFTGGQYIRIYSGTSGATNGCFIIPTNANWDVDTQTWNKPDTSEPSSALMFTYKRVRISTVAVGTDSWGNWPSSYPSTADANALGFHVVGNAMVSGWIYGGSNLEVSGNMTSGGAVFCSDVNAGDDVTAGGDALITGAIVAGGRATVDSVVMTGLNGIRYAAGVNRTTKVNALVGVSEDVEFVNGNISLLASSPCWRINPATSIWYGVKRGNLAFPLHLPQGAYVNSVKAWFFQPGGVNQLIFRLYQGNIVEAFDTYTYGNNGEAAAAVGDNNGLTVINIGAGNAGMQVSGLAPISIMVTNPNFDYNDADHPTPAMVKMIEVAWTDYGPASACVM